MEEEVNGMSIDCPRLEQLVNIAFHGPVSDGNLISKDAAKALEKHRLIYRREGFSVLSLKGLDMLIALNLVKY